MKIKWTNIVPLHPLYYIDFPDLRKIIVQKDNWREVFKGIFAREDLISAALGELEPIRNKIAHNRKATESDLETMKTIYAKVSTMVGNDTFQSLSGRCTHQSDIPETLQKLKSLAEKLRVDCVNCNPVEDIALWTSVSNVWWFDESYLGHPVKGIRDFFETIERYTTMPRKRGSGHAIESWVASQRVEDRFLVAASEFAVLQQ